MAGSPQGHPVTRDSLELAGKGCLCREMINSPFADLLPALRGAESGIVGCLLFCVKAVKVLCRAVMVNEVSPEV